VGRKGRVALLLGTAIALAVISGSDAAIAARAASARVAAVAQVARTLDVAPTAVSSLASLGGTVQQRTFKSTALERTMPYRIYLPPGYDAQPSRRYPTVYLLHGMGGSDAQWQDIGITQAADRLIDAGTIAPLIMVMPEGENAYWVDHATDGQKWGRYTAVDVVADVESHFRTLAGKQSRAIGGLSMGAHGALQLALNYPGEFAAVGAHSLVLRRFGSAPSYFGAAADFAKRDPVQLVAAKGKTGCSFSLWIDIGDKDPWVSNAEQFNGELNDLGVAHQWHLWSGDHSGSYWSAHVVDYLRFYDAALAGRAPRGGSLY
jgi:S-formylglutathione hydrolase FrmB